MSSSGRCMYINMAFLTPFTMPITLSYLSYILTFFYIFSAEAKHMRDWSNTIYSLNIPVGVSPWMLYEFECCVGLGPIRCLPGKGNQGRAHSAE